MFVRGAHHSHLLVLLRGVDVVYLGLVDLDPAPLDAVAVDIDLHVEHLRGQVEAAVDGRGHELESDLAPDGL